MVNNHEKIACRFKALSDPNRVWILELLRDKELCACELLELLSVSQSTLSHHMKILVDTKFVRVRKDGKWSHYTIENEGVVALLNYLEQFRR